MFCHALSSLVLGYSEITLLSNFIVLICSMLAVLGYSEITLLSNKQYARNCQERVLGYSEITLLSNSRRKALARLYGFRLL